MDCWIFSTRTFSWERRASPKSAAIAVRFLNRGLSWKIKLPYFSSSSFYENYALLKFLSRIIHLDILENILNCFNSVIHYISRAIRPLIIPISRFRECRNPNKNLNWTKNQINHEDVAYKFSITSRSLIKLLSHKNFWLLIKKNDSRAKAKINSW